MIRAAENLYEPHQLHLELAGAARLLHSSTAGTAPAWLGPSPAATASTGSPGSARNANWAALGKPTCVINLSFYLAKFFGLLRYFRLREVVSWPGFVGWR